MRAETSTWLQMADEDLAAARVLLEAALLRSTVFHLHLSAEKTLKALVWEVTGVQPPFTHSLVRLGALANIVSAEPYAEILANLSLQIGARYEEQPIYTEQFCRGLLSQTVEVTQWLRQTLT
jgi:HEPN domain-containing protein